MRIDNFMPTVIQLLLDIPGDWTDIDLQLNNKGYNNGSTIYFRTPQVTLRYRTPDGETHGKIILLDDNYSLNILHRE